MNYSFIYFILLTLFLLTTVVHCKIGVPKPPPVMGPLFKVWLKLAVVMVKFIHWYLFSKKIFIHWYLFAKAAAIPLARRISHFLVNWQKLTLNEDIMSGVKGYTKRFIKILFLEKNSREWTRSNWFSWICN